MGMELARITASRSIDNSEVIFRGNGGTPGAFGGVSKSELTKSSAANTHRKGDVLLIISTINYRADVTHKSTERDPR